MALAKCVRRCWDSQSTKRYYIGDIADLPSDHAFFKGKMPCFQILTPEDVAQSEESAGAKINQLTQMVGDLMKRLEFVGDKTEVMPEMKHAAKAK